MPQLLKNHITEVKGPALGNTIPYWLGYWPDPLSSGGIETIYLR